MFFVQTFILLQKYYKINVENINKFIGLILLIVYIFIPIWAGRSLDTLLCSEPTMLLRWFWILIILIVLSIASRYTNEMNLSREYCLMKILFPS